MVEATTAASHGLAREAEKLRELLAQFRFAQHSFAKVVERRPDATKPARAVASPARKLMAKVAQATTGDAAAAQAQESWEEL